MAMSINKTLDNIFEFLSQILNFLLNDLPPLI